MTHWIMTHQNSQITDVDLQMLLAQNPLAAEQLRRIIAERQLSELKAQIAGPDTTTTNNKNDSKLTAVGAD